MNTSSQSQAPVRKYFQSGNLKLSYLDYGATHQKILLMLHGHMGNARTFSELASRFEGWRIVVLDQRGHGWSEHPPERDYSRESYIIDLLTLIRQELDGQSVHMLGHSLGGINAYQFAARYPELITSVIVEDIGVEISGDHFAFVQNLPDRSASPKELRDSLVRAGLRNIDYFSASVFEDERGWGFRSDLPGMRISQRNINGVWWQDWLDSTCPMLLIHGSKSFALNLEQAQRMAIRRPNTKLAVFEQCGHGVHSDDLDGFYQTVQAFLDEQGDGCA